MKEGFYLLSYVVNGIKNIDKDVRLEFYKKTIDDSFDPSEYNVKAIYGENGTGKSGIIWSVRLLKNLLINKNYLTDSNNVYVLKDLINKKKKELKIEIIFLYKGISTEGKNNIHMYKYCICIFYDEKVDGFFIKYEKLDEVSLSSKKSKNIYEINNGEIINSIDKKLFDKLNEGNGVDTLKEQSFISNFSFKNFNKYINEDFEKYTNKQTSLLYAIFMCAFFAKNLFIYLDENDRLDSYVANVVLSYFLNNKEVKETEQPKLYLNAINDSVIKYENTVNKKDFDSFKNDVYKIYEFIKIFKPDLKSIEIEKYENKEAYKCNLIFVYDEYKVNPMFESNGVKKLIKLYKAIDAVDKGSIVFIDEFDSNIHDVYLSRLLEYIEEYATGQLCFTTQSITIMDVLENRKKSLDFLSRDHDIVSWFKNSHYPAAKKYKEGYINKSPFNIEPFDFLKAFGAALDEK